jgi:hypothetical protein
MKSKQSQILRSPIVAERVRSIDGGFVYVPHRFLQGGFFASLEQRELLLYFLLVLAGDRYGVSFYGVDTLCGLLRFETCEYISARNGLIEKDLIAFDGRRFQVLSLPAHPKADVRGPLITQEDFEEKDPATIREVIRRSLDSNK